jgi:hypothetical protein
LAHKVSATRKDFPIYRRQESLLLAASVGGQGELV